MYEEGQAIKVSIYDNFFKDYFIATGVLLTNIYGKLWLLKPDKHRRLSGIDIHIHESWILGD